MDAQEVDFASRFLRRHVFPIEFVLFCKMRRSPILLSKKWWWLWCFSDVTAIDVVIVSPPSRSHAFLRHKCFFDSKNDPFRGFLDDDGDEQLTVLLFMSWFVSYPPSLLTVYQPISNWYFERFCENCTLHEQNRTAGEQTWKRHDMKHHIMDTTSFCLCVCQESTSPGIIMTVSQVVLYLILVFFSLRGKEKHARSSQRYPKIEVEGVL